jgi:excisionase family DNA binding protein
VTPLCSSGSSALSSTDQTSGFRTCGQVASRRLAADQDPGLGALPSPVRNPAPPSAPHPNGRATTSETNTPSLTTDCSPGLSTKGPEGQLVTLKPACLGGSGAPWLDQIRLSWYEHKLDDEYLTVREVAEHLKLNQQTVRNWIDAGTLPAVRIGRRVRVRRVDLERVLAQDTSGSVRPEPSPVASDTLVEAREQLAQALAPARRLLGRRSAVRRTELADGLQELTDAVAAALTLLSNNASATGVTRPVEGR